MVWIGMGMCVSEYLGVSCLLCWDVYVWLIWCGSGLQVCCAWPDHGVVL